MGEVEREGPGEEISQDPGDRGCGGVSEEGVAGEREVDLIDGVELREAADDFPAAFAVQGFDVVTGGERGEKPGEGVAVEGGILRRGGGGIGGCEQVDRAAGTVEQRVLRVEISGTGGDAAERLAGLAGDRERHAVGFQGGAADEQGVHAAAEVEQALVVLG